MTKLKWLLMSSFSLPPIHLIFWAGLLIKSEEDRLILHNGAVELAEMLLQRSFSFSTSSPLKRLRLTQ
jgi:hypothetical protein